MVAGDPKQYFNDDQATYCPSVIQAPEGVPTMRVHRIDGQCEQMVCRGGSTVLLARGHQDEIPFFDPLMEIRNG
jgi:hypothetical protein